MGEEIDEVGTLVDLWPSPRVESHIAIVVGRVNDDTGVLLINKESYIHGRLNISPPLGPNNPTPSMNHILPNLTLPIIRPLKPIRMRLIIRHSLHNLIPARDHKRSILHDRLVKRQTSNQDES